MANPQEPRQPRLVVSKLGDDISTDAIYPGRFMATVLPTETPKLAFADDAELNAKLNSGTLPPGSVIVAGRNFGCGSSRDQAASCLRGHGITIVARAFARIFLHDQPRAPHGHLPGDRGRRGRRARHRRRPRLEQHEGQRVRCRAASRGAPGDHRRGGPHPLHAPPPSRITSLERKLRQDTERRIGELRRRKTLPFNGYADQVASLYAGMDLRKQF